MRHVTRAARKAALVLALLLSGCCYGGCSSLDLDRQALATNEVNVAAITEHNETLLDAAPDTDPDFAASVRARNEAARRLASELAKVGE